MATSIILAWLITFVIFKINDGMLNFLPNISTLSVNISADFNNTANEITNIAIVTNINEN